MIVQLILSSDLKTIEALAKVCKDHHAELASTLIHIFCSYNKVVPLINACLEKSVDNEGTCVHTYVRTYVCVNACMCVCVCVVCMCVCVILRPSLVESLCFLE